MPLDKILEKNPTKFIRKETTAGWGGKIVLKHNQAEEFSTDLPNLEEFGSKLKCKVHFTDSLLYKTELHLRFYFP